MTAFKYVRRVVLVATIFSLLLVASSAAAPNHNVESRISGATAPFGVTTTTTTPATNRRSSAGAISQLLWSSTTTIPRGGAITRTRGGLNSQHLPRQMNRRRGAGGTVSITKTQVIQLHGLCAFFFGACFAAETFGFVVPYVGPAVLLKGWDDFNPALVYMTRFAAGLLVMVGLVEASPFAETPALQSIFVQYHVPLAALCWLSSNDSARDSFGHLYAALVTLFGIAGILAE